MRKFPVFLAAMAFATLLGSGCSTTLYTLEPVTSPQARLTQDQDAITLVKGEVSVTVGPLGPVHGAGFNLGVLVNNDSDEELRLRLQGARVLVNGNAAPLMDRAQVEKVKRMDRLAGAMSAASTSLAQSNVRLAQGPDQGTADERRGDVERTSLEQGMERTLAAQQLQNAAVQAQGRLGRQYAAELMKTNSVNWNDTYEVRWAMPQNIHLIDQHLWRDETIPPRSWVLRCLVTQEGSIAAALSGKGGSLGVEIELAGERFVYSFDAVARSLGEANSEIEKRRARILEARQK